MKIKIRKLLCSVLSLAVFAGVFAPFTVSASGTDTSSLPEVNGVYEISTVAQFDTFRTEVDSGTDSFTGKTVLQMNDLNLSGQTLSTLSTGYKFSGTFDGQGHTISNYTDSKHTLFPDIDKSGVIQNLMVNATVVYSSGTTNFMTSNWGILTSYFSGTIRDVEISGSMTVNTDDYLEVWNDECQAMHTLTVSPFGESASGGTVTDCISNVNFYMTGDPQNYYNNENLDLVIFESISQGGTGSGCYYNGTYHCYYYDDTDYSEIGIANFDTSYPIVYDSNKNPMIATGTNKGATPKTTAEMHEQSTYSYLDFDGIWAIDPSVNGGLPFLNITKQTVNLTLNPVVADKIWDASETSVQNLVGTVTGYTIDTSNLTGVQKALLTNYNVMINNDYTATATFTDRQGSNIPVAVSTTKNPTLSFTPNSQYNFVIGSVGTTAVGKLSDNGAAGPTVGSGRYNQLIADSKSAINLALKNLYGDGSNAGGYGNEWPIMDFARCGYPVRPGYFDEYFKKLDSDFAAMKAGTYKTSSGSSISLSDLHATDYERVLLAISAIGYDPSDVSAVDIVKTIENTAMTDTNDMSKAFGLMALDSGRYDLSGGVSVREQLIASLTDTANGDTANGLIDYTGMDLQPLAPYYIKDATDTPTYANYYDAIHNVTYNAYAVKTAVDHALQMISESQNNEGGWGGWGQSVNLDSTMEGLTAVSEMGINALTDSAYVKNGQTMADSLYGFVDLSTGALTNSIGSVDMTGMYELPYGLNSMLREIAGQNNLYGMSDVTSVAGVKAAVANIKSGDQNAEQAAFALYNKLDSYQKSYVDNDADSVAEHTSNGVTATGLPWYVVLNAAQQPDGSSTWENISSLVGNKKVLYVTNITPTDMLTDEEYRPGSGRSVSVTISSPSVSGYMNVQIAHLKPNGTLEYLTPTADNGTLTFAMTSFSPVAVVADLSASTNGSGNGKQDVSSSENNENGSSSTSVSAENRKTSTTGRESNTGYTAANGTAAAGISDNNSKIDTGAASSSSTSSGSTGSGGNGNSGYANAVKAPQAHGSHNILSYIWIAIVVAGVTVIVLLVLQKRRSNLKAK